MSEAPLRYPRAGRPGVLESFKPEIHRRLRDDPRLPGVRVRELLEPLGARRARRWSMIICARSGRCSCRRRGSISGRCIARARYVSSMCWSRASWCRSGMVRGAAAGWSSRAWATRARARGCWCSAEQTEDLLAGIAGCLVRLGALPRTLVWDRQAGVHGHGGRPF